MVYLECGECGCIVIQGLVKPNSQCTRCEGGRFAEVEQLPSESGRTRRFLLRLGRVHKARP